MADEFGLGWIALHDDCACGNKNPAQESAQELMAEIVRLRLVVKEMGGTIAEELGVTLAP